MIRPEGAGGPDREDGGPAGRRMGAWGKGLVIAGLAAAAFAIAGAVALLIAGHGSRTVTVTTGPAPQRLQNPPWGFTSGWADYCYRALPAPEGYAATVIPPSHPCPDRTTRLGTKRQIALTSRAGAGIDRLAVSWDAVERRPPVEVNGSRVHRFNWSLVTRVYDAMLSADIRPVVLAYGAPIWARRSGWDRPGACHVPYGERCSYPPARRRVADWRNFISALVRRFPRMMALEVWNEPNLPRFFAPAPSPELYSRLLEAAHDAVSASGVSVPVVSGGLAAGTSGTGAAMVAPRFLRGVYRHAGKASFDGIGSHPYPQGPPWVAQMTANLDKLRRVRDRFRDHGTPLWITEVGVGGAPMPRPEGSVDPARQGPLLVRMYRSTVNTDVRAFLVYALRETKTEGPHFEPYGVVHANLSPKLAYCSLASHLGGVSICD